MAARRRTRVGIAAFALGLSLAGPQATGVAAADGGDDATGISPATAQAPGTAHRPGKTVAATARRTPAEAAIGAGTDPSATAPLRTPLPVPRGAAAQDAQPGTGSTAAITRPGRSVKGVAAQTFRSSPKLHPVANTPVSDTPTAPTPPAPRSITASSPLAAAGAPASQPADQVAAPAPTGPAQLTAGVNTAITGLFDAAADWLSTLPANPISELLSGALLLVRRTLFDQVPTAAPVQTTPYRSHGQILGTLGASDAEGDPLTYEVVTQPAYGTASVDAEGHYTYTPGPDFAGSLTPDTFTVRVTDANGGFNLLDPFGSRSIDVVVDAPDPDTPFFDGNNDDVAVFLSDAAAGIAVSRQGGTLWGSVTLDVPADTVLRWLDEKGRNGTVSIAEVASDWTKITDSGVARLGISYTAGGAEYTAILDSVRVDTGDDGSFVFSGELAPDVHDGDGVDCYYDVIGGTYKSQYESFLTAVSAADSFQTDVTGAKVFLDTWSVADYVDELAGAAPVVGVAAPFPMAANNPPAASGPFTDSAALQGAVQFARNGIGFGGSADPVFSLAPYAPACTTSGGCTGTFYYESLSTQDLITAAQGTFSYEGRSVDVAFDFSGAAYGYVYVPDGVWDKLDYDMYSAGVFVGVTAGPSLTVNLGSQGGTFALASQQLPQAQYYNTTPYGTIAVTGDLTADLDATLGLPTGTVRSLSASLLGTAGAVVTYNTGGVAGFQMGGSDYFLNADFADFTSISGVALTLTLKPAVTAAWGLFTPDSTPIIGRVSFLEVGLGYTNSQLSATLNIAEAPSLTLRSAGSLGLSAGLFSALTDELTYTGSLDLGYTTDNLLA